MVSWQRFAPFECSLVLWSSVIFADKICWFYPTNASALENWRKPPGCPCTSWMKIIQQDLESFNLSVNKAVDVAQNHPLWRLMFTSGAMHSQWCMPEMDEPLLTLNSNAKILLQTDRTYLLNEWMTKTCNARSCRTSRIWGAGSRRAGWGGYTLQVVREVRWVFNRRLKVSKVFDASYFNLLINLLRH